MLKVKLVGVLRHGDPNQAYVFTLKEDFASDGNLTIHCLLSVLLTMDIKSLPKKLMIQMDNTSRENKNNTVLRFAGYLVERQLFESVVISFLPVGHTHCDVDQLFSCFSRELKARPPRSYPDLCSALCRSYAHLR